MPFSLTWLPQVLKDKGLKVSLSDGWENRGRGEMGTIKGVICHHTATPKSAANMPTLNMLIKGRSDLPGPLAQLGLGRDGTFFVVASGRCNHAGKGSWQGITTGNTSFIGIEAENSGLKDDSPWPEVQMDAYRRGVAAILEHIGQPADFCAGHKEYALPKGRKDDPDFDMNEFRKGVAALMQGAAPASAPAATAAPAPKPGPKPAPPKPVAAKTAKPNKPAAKKGAAKSAPAGRSKR